MKCAPRLCCATSHVHAVPDVGVVRILESLRHHADDGEQRTVERDRSCRRSTGSPPNRSRHSRWLMTAIRLARVDRRLRETRRRAPAARRAPQKKFGVVSTALTRSGSCPVSVSVSCGYHHAGGVLEDLRQAAIVDEVDRRDPLVRQPLAVVRLPHHRQAIGVGIRQRPQHDAIEHAEDRGGRADAERQRQHGGNGEARACGAAGASRSGCPEAVVSMRARRSLDGRRRRSRRLADRRKAQSCQRESERVDARSARRRRSGRRSDVPG